MIGTFLRRADDETDRPACRPLEHVGAVDRQPRLTTAPLQQKMDAICESVGRDPTTLERSVAVLVDFPGAYGRPGQAVPSLTGSPEELAEEFRDYAARGRLPSPALPRPLHRRGDRDAGAGAGAPRPG